METLIDWSQEAKESFAYPEARVALLIEMTRRMIEQTSVLFEAGQVEDPRGMHKKSLQLRKEALLRWSNAADLSREATRMVEIARAIDRTGGLTLQKRLHRFFEAVGGERNFRLVFEALSCAGALHYIADTITASYWEKS